MGVVLKWWMLYLKDMVAMQHGFGPLELLYQSVTTSILAFLLKNRTTLIAVAIKIIVHGTPRWGKLSGSILHGVCTFQGGCMWVRNIRQRKQRNERKRQRHRIESGGQFSECWVCSCLFSIYLYTIIPPNGRRMQKTYVIWYKKQTEKLSLQYVKHQATISWVKYSVV